MKDNLLQKKEYSFRGLNLTLALPSQVAYLAPISSEAHSLARIDCTSACSRFVGVAPHQLPLTTVQGKLASRLPGRRQ